MSVWKRFVRLLFAGHFVPEETIEKENELQEVMAHLHDIAKRNQDARVLLQRIIDARRARRSDT